MLVAGINPANYNRACPCGKGKINAMTVAYGDFRTPGTVSCVGCGRDFNYWTDYKMAKTTVIEEFDSEGNLVKKTTVTEPGPDPVKTDWSKLTWPYYNHGGAIYTTPKDGTYTVNGL